MTGLKKALRSRRGFTLVELVVVLVIAGITASFAVPALTGYKGLFWKRTSISR